MLRLQVEPRQVELVDLRERGLRDREILNRETRRVEQRHVFGASPAVGVAREHGTELGHVFPRDGAGLNCSCELSAVTCLLEGVYE
jgi:hypothetical protein